MVLQRLNQEIIRQSSLGEQGVTSLQPLQNINGLEMFGFLSPHIIQVKYFPASFIFYKKNLLTHVIRPYPDTQEVHKSSLSRPVHPDPDPAF